ncbi:MAG: thiopurine S-methyltransferase [FCB group bacterium]|nr:thiopurine S-methyltransferase [FCB group bacterium]MBL7028919.1 thiopurine S-methyltransferase [Candidatus Neomarinimicrobiota bacterium]MBL7122757.1 thiopurine S-methyltransferase [Candidatus Neomarinimicrobiota bacterium]
MNIESWKQAWETNNIGFHKSKPHPQLVKYFGELNLIPGSRVFLPLCGKTLDIAWLLAQGMQVVGSEASQLAVEQLFQELGLEPSIMERSNGSCFSAENVTVYVGDIFELSEDDLGEIDAIYDRAALVALPIEHRKLYTKLLVDISRAAPQLLITFEYDQNLKTGPPFSIDSGEIYSHYNNTYVCTLVDSYMLPAGLKGSRVATENLWLLKK